jgi:hypothetical protein
MRAGRARWTRWPRLLLAVLLFGATGVAAPPVAACSGGTAVDWAVAHQRGGIVRGIVVAAEDRPDFTTDLTVANLERVQGNPPPYTTIHTVAGAVCDQRADPGETVVVIYDVRGGEVPYRLPLYYVVKGPDALEPDVAAALFGPVATFTSPSETASRNETLIGVESTAAPPTGLVLVAIALAGLFALVLLLVARRRRRG